MESPHHRLPPEVLLLLEERAKRLARPIEQATAPISQEHQESYLCVRTLTERYGLPLEAVGEVIQLQAVMAIPQTPGHVVGLIRLRGRILTLVDLRRFWRAAAVGVGDSDLAVVLRVRGVDFGLVCSEVEDLIDLSAADIQKAPENLPARMLDSLRGLARRDILLIDPGRLINLPGFLVGLPEEEDPL